MRIIKLLLVVMLVAIGFSFYIQSASATPSPSTAPFKTYSTTVTWYKAGGTLDNVWPQNRTKISCGGIKQVDTYTITSEQMKKDFQQLILGGVLTGGADDYEFNPHNYYVKLLPACVTATPTPSESSSSPPPVVTCSSIPKPESCKAPITPSRVPHTTPPPTATKTPVPDVVPASTDVPLANTGSPTALLLGIAGGLIMLGCVVALIGKPRGIITERKEDHRGH